MAATTYILQFVINRKGEKEPISFDKITNRLTKLSEGLRVNPVFVAKKVISKLTNLITTKELDLISEETCANLIQEDPDYDTLATRIFIDNLHKNTNEFYENEKLLHEQGLISTTFMENLEANREKICQAIDYSRDYNYDYNGVKTLEKLYMFKDDKGKTVERPQDMLMRVALCIHEKDIKLVLESYECMSKFYFTHASPTLFNAGMNNPQLCSCFIQSYGDSIEGIFDNGVCDSAKISKWGGGIGLCLSDIRARDSKIKSNGGKSDGIIPLCVLLDKLGRYINQSNKRNGSIATYLEPWHADIEEFVELKKNVGDENKRARDLFLALWVPDLFMKRVKKDEVWSLMSPDECPGLTESYGEKFEELYTRYEKEGKYRKQVKATELWRQVLKAQFETGIPYIAFKDHVNRKTNHQNLGVIKSSNLCIEIMEYFDQDNIACCNLSSICLNKFVNQESQYFDFVQLGKITRIVVRNLNKIIDLNYYPVEKARRSNLANRPIGIGVQGLADVYMMMGYPFESLQARQLNKDIFETIYYFALLESNELAKIHGPYKTFQGSPFSQGVLQFDMWNIEEKELKYDWSTLKQSIMTHGTYNSLLTALMPTASTSKITKTLCECFEPILSNVFSQKTLSGERIHVNRYLVNDLIKLGLWNKSLLNQLLMNNGSVQKLDIPDKLKELYKTSFEIKQSAIILQSAERGSFVDQSQSMNLFFATPNIDKLHSCHMYSWELGLKTGVYYLRSQPASSAIKFGVSNNEEQTKKKVCTDEVCIMCSG